MLLTGPHIKHNFKTPKFSIEPSFHKTRNSSKKFETNPQSPCEYEKHLTFNEKDPKVSQRQFCPFENVNISTIIDGDVNRSRDNIFDKPDSPMSFRASKTQFNFFPDPEQQIGKSSLVMNQT